MLRHIVEIAIATHFTTHNYIYDYILGTRHDPEGVVFVVEIAVLRHRVEIAIKVHELPTLLPTIIFTVTYWAHDTIPKA